MASGLLPPARVQPPHWSWWLLTACLSGVRGPGRQAGTAGKARGWPGLTGLDLPAAGSHGGEPGEQEIGAGVTCAEPGQGTWARMQGSCRCRD